VRPAGLEPATPGLGNHLGSIIYGIYWQFLIADVQTVANKRGPRIPRASKRTTKRVRMTKADARPRLFKFHVPQNGASICKVLLPTGLTLVAPLVEPCGLTWICPQTTLVRDGSGKPAQGCNSVVLRPDCQRRVLSLDTDGLLLLECGSTPSLLNKQERRSIALRLNR
jgi:hypothetical protein